MGSATAGSVAVRVAIRVDASVRIGSGHVMRCLALADALQRQGGEVVFLCREHPGHLGGEITQRGHRLSMLPPHPTPLPQGERAHADWLGASLHDEIAACRSVLQPGVDLLVVDHYALDRSWEEAMRPLAGAIMAIDDLADREHDCDLLLDQNLLPDMRERYCGKVPARCRLLLGPEYALLREEFRNAVRTERDGTLRRLLIFFGGSDPDNLTGRALRELQGLSIAADVVIGTANPHRNDIEALCQGSGGQRCLHVQTDRMAELMAHADLALGAGGGTHWERCHMGLPAVVVTVAANQIPTTRLLHEKGACFWLGDVRTLPDGAFRRAVEDLGKEPGKLLQMGFVAHRIVPADGGADKVVKALEALF